MYLAIISLPLLGSIVSGFFGRKNGFAGAQSIFVSIGLRIIKLLVKTNLLVTSFILKCNIIYLFYILLLTYPVVFKLFIYLFIFYIINDYNFKNCKQKILIISIQAFICYCWQDNLLILGNNIPAFLPGLLATVFLTDIEFSLFLLPKLLSSIVNLGLKVWFNKKTFFFCMISFFCLRNIFTDIFCILNIITNAFIESTFFSLLSYYFTVSVFNLLFPNLNIKALIIFFKLDTFLVNLDIEYLKNFLGIDNFLFMNMFNSAWLILSNNFFFLPRVYLRIIIY